MDGWTDVLVESEVSGEKLSNQGGLSWREQKTHFWSRIAQSRASTASALSALSHGFD